MLILLLAYTGGVLTIFSPCVLPVIPFLFARSDKPFRSSGLPMLVGMALSFAAFAGLSAAGGNWVIRANQYGRYVALVVFTVVGLSLLFEKVAQKILQPLVNIGALLQKKANPDGGTGSSLLIGASVGLLWAPCAGPILGLVLAGAAVGGLSHNTFTLLGAFAAGAATSLGVAILASGNLMRTLKRGFGVEEKIKKGLGVIVLLAVAAIATGLDTKLLAQFSYLNTNSLEQKLVDQVAPRASSTVGPAAGDQSKPLADEGVMPALTGAATWLNSGPLDAEQLKGKVVLIDFWTYSCINCLRTLPYLKAWAEKYGPEGLVVIGVHAPEFAFERVPENVEKAVRDLQIRYPVAVDSQLTIWSAFSNQYWPAHYFIDAHGHIRHHHFGEGKYDESETVIKELLREAHPERSVDAGVATVAAKGVELAPGSFKDIATPETYLGHERQRGFSSTPALVPDVVTTYTLPATLALNQWGLGGAWSVADEMATAKTAGAKLKLTFKARDLHLVLANPNGKPLRIRVTLDGQQPGAAHGGDTDEHGLGTITSQRLYQLIRQSQSEGQHEFAIEFLDAEAQAFAFTFG